jgi:hypothetical protein
MSTRILIFLLLLSTAYSSAVSTKSDSVDTTLTLVKTLGANIEASIENNNPSYINGLINTDSMIINSVTMSANTEENIFFEGFKEGFTTNFDLGVSLIAEMGESGSYSFMYAYKCDGRYALTFRMIGISGVNYHRYSLVQHENGFAIMDVYNFFTGETMTEIISRMFAIGRSMAYMAERQDLALLNNWLSYMKIDSYFSDGKYKKALKKWRLLPEEDRLSKNLLSLGLRIAKHLDSTAFYPVFNQFMIHYPESGGKYLMALDGLSMQGETTLALTCADSLDVYLNGDPVLDLMRANVHYTLGNYAISQELLEEVVESMPDYESPYVSLLGLYLETNKYTEATDLLDQIRFRFSSYKEDLRPLLVGYPEFLKSAEFAKWMNP